MSDFSDRPFAAGSLTGVRAFKVDELGRLKGPSAGSVFRDGENVARCNGIRGSDWLLRLPSPPKFGTAAERSAWNDLYVREERRAKELAETHQVANVRCSCGYYAYFDKGSNPYADLTTIYGLIEGYGVCTVGDRGFRAEKARLVALVDPTAKGLLDREFGDPWLLARINLAIALITAATAIWSATESLWLSAILNVLATSINAWLFLWNRSRSHGARASRKFDRVRTAYPDVPVYPSLRAAYRAHPLTVPPPPVLPTPETAEDFWTRSAR